MRRTKLVLNAETLKSLTEPQAQFVQGGMRTIQFQGCDSHEVGCIKLTLTACRPSYVC